MVMGCMDRGRLPKYRRVRLSKEMHKRRNKICKNSKIKKEAFAGTTSIYLID